MAHMTAKNIHIDEHTEKKVSLSSRPRHGCILFYFLLVIKIILKQALLLSNCCLQVLRRANLKVLRR